MARRIETGQVATSTPFDNSGNGFVADNVQDAIEEAATGTVSSRTIEYSFFNSGANIKNKWLDIEASNIPVNDTPAVVPFDAQLLGLTYSNSKDSSTIDIEIYKNGTAPGDKVFTWDINTARYAWKSTGLSGVTFSQGDVFFVFAKGAGGTAPQRPVVKLTILATSTTPGEGSSATL